MDGGRRQLNIEIDKCVVGACEDAMSCRTWPSVSVKHCVKVYNASDISFLHSISYYKVIFWLPPGNQNSYNDTCETCERIRAEITQDIIY